MEKKRIDVEKSEEKERERSKMVRFLGKLIVLFYIRMQLPHSHSGRFLG